MLSPVTAIAIAATPSTKAKAPNTMSSAERVMPGQTSATTPKMIAATPRSASINERFEKKSFMIFSFRLPPA